MKRKPKQFVWTDEAQETFEKLKRALLDIVTLAYPIPGLPCILDTDASDVAVGAVLSQKIDGVEKRIAFYSAVLNRTQQNYCATRREMLAVVKSLQHFRHYLPGAKVILRTDHHSLLWLWMYKNPTGIMARWIETMAEFDIEIQHRSGRLHSNDCNLGAVRTTVQLKTHYYWVGLNRDVRQWCRQCAQCARAKGAPLRPHGHMQNIIAGAPMDFVTMDILSGLPVTTDGSKYILVVCDHFTKWVEAYALPDQEASTCRRAAYDGFFSRFSYPLQIHMDQGQNFESALFKEMCALTGVNKSSTTPFHPRSDGLTERASRTLLQMLRVTCEGDPASWPSKLPTVLSAYRSTRHKATGVTPNMALLGRETMLPCSLTSLPPLLFPLWSSTAITCVPPTLSHESISTLTLKLRNGTSTPGLNQCRITSAKKCGFTGHGHIRQRHRKLFNQWAGPFTIVSF